MPLSEWLRIRRNEVSLYRPCTASFTVKILKLDTRQN